MKKIGALIIIGSIAVLSVVGCQEPGVTAVFPAPVMEAPITGGGGSPQLATNCNDDTDTDTAEAPTSCTCTCSAAATGTGGKSAAARPICDCACGDTRTQTQVTTGSAGTAGKATGKAGANGGKAGRVGTAGSKSGAGGSTGGSTVPVVTPPATKGPAPCPAGWTCTDLGSMGVKVTDSAGKVYQNSCGNNSLTDCTDANVATACAALTVPFCATINVAGQDLRSCAQDCIP